MRWRGRRQSKHVEDRRFERSTGMGGMRGMGGSGMLRLLPAVVRLLGPKGTLIAVLAVGAFLLFGGNLGSLLGGIGMPASTAVTTSAPASSKAEDEQVAFVRTVLADTEDTWRMLFDRAGREYRYPHLVLYRDAVPSACGTGHAAMGPFYCPGDDRVYLDLGFFDELAQRHDAPGDFAQAYVIAHEIGHHVQNLLGTSTRVQQARRALDEAAGNRLSVRLELQADCYAGLWAHHAERSRQLLEKGDVEEGLNAASAIGDDRLQREARGRVSPDSFTHGTSEQRMRWFSRGYQEGNLDACDTFAEGVRL